MCETESNGVAIFEYTLTMRQGDNFSVVASPDEAYINNLVLLDDGINLGDPNDFEIPVTTSSANTCASTNQKACRADILTVWRRLHIEEDSMGVVSGNLVTGTITGAIQTQSGTSLFVDVTLEAWQYEQGTIVIDKVGTFPVADNTSNEIISHSLISPQDAVGNSFILYDDDDYNKTNPVNYGDNNEDVARTETTFSRMQTSDDPEKNVFAPVYILPIYDGGGGLENNDNSLNFVLNLEEENFEDQIDLGRDSGSSESDSFWVSYVQLAYQPNTSNDRDPDTDRGIIPDDTDLGVTPNVIAIDVIPADCSGVPRGAHGSLLFLEVIRDIYDLEKLIDTGLTAPHEIAHQFGVLGDQNGHKIMSSELNSEPMFIAEHIHLLRCRAKSPGQQ